MSKTSSSSNPDVRHAADDAGADAGASPFGVSPQQALDFLQRMWNPFGLAMPGQSPATPDPAAMTAVGGMPFPHPAAFVAALDPAQVQHKIDELRVIEGWLQMSLSMMQMSIKTMELQKASLEAMRGAPADRAGTK